MIPTGAAAARLERTGTSPKAVSENTALTRLDANRSRTALELALQGLAGGLTVREASAVDKLLRDALADAYEAGWAAGYAQHPANRAGGAR
jgi:hypothetical protein